MHQWSQPEGMLYETARDTLGLHIGDLTQQLIVMEQDPCSPPQNVAALRERQQRLHERRMALSPVDPAGCQAVIDEFGDQVRSS